MKMTRLSVSTAFLALAYHPVLLAQDCSVMCNGGFDSVIVAPTSNVHVTSAQLPCWQTASPDSLMEIWANGYGGINSYSGAQFMEINSFTSSTVYQNITVVPGSTLKIRFAHRGRGGIDTVGISIGPVGGPYVSLGSFGDGTGGWGYHLVTYTLPPSGSAYSIRFTPLYWASGDSTIGNFLDAVEICSYIQCNLICNGDFDDTFITNSNSLIHSSLLPCWETTSSDTIVEVWGSNLVKAYSGSQYVELNAYMPATLYQNFACTPGKTLSISFAHRGRGGIDSMGVSAGPAGGPYTNLGIFGDNSSSWGFYTVNYTVPNAGTIYSIRFTSVYWGNGNPTIGNFLDAVDICEVTGINEPVVHRDVELFPNPAVDWIDFSLSQLPEPVEWVSLFNAAGLQMANFHPESPSPVRVDLNGYENGIYFIRVRTARSIATGRFVVLK